MRDCGEKRLDRIHSGSNDKITAQLARWCSEENQLSIIPRSDRYSNITYMGSEPSYSRTLFMIDNLIPNCPLGKRGPFSSTIFRFSAILGQMPGTLLSSRVVLASCSIRTRQRRVFHRGLMMRCLNSHGPGRKRCS